RAGEEDLRRVVRQLREQFTTLRAIDFFAAPVGAEVEKALNQLEASLRRPSDAEAGKAKGDAMEVADYQGRTWVTRPRPGVDRFASAWLIARFIDPDATFEFAKTVDRNANAVPFDMFGHGFGHEGNACTFEVLAQRFGIGDPAVRRIGEIVHDLDLKEERFR